MAEPLTSKKRLAALEEKVAVLEKRLQTPPAPRIEYVPIWIWYPYHGWCYQWGYRYV